jgi:hypothetical protein
MSGRGDPKGVRPGRRVRVDRSEEGESMPVPAPKSARKRSAGWRSGRLFVTAVVVAVLVLWGSLYLIFSQWRSRYRERAAFGARFVASAIDPLADVLPAGEPPISTPIETRGATATPRQISPAAWREAVAETHAMLVTLTAANVMDMRGMHALGERISALVARARPSTARGELARLWDEIEKQAGPIVRARHPRPALLRPSAAGATKDDQSSIEIHHGQSYYYT